MPSARPSTVMGLAALAVASAAALALLVPGDRGARGGARGEAEGAARAGRDAHDGPGGDSGLGSANEGRDARSRAGRDGGLRGDAGPSSARATDLRPPSSGGASGARGSDAARAAAGAATNDASGGSAGASGAPSEVRRASAAELAARGFRPPQAERMGIVKGRVVAGSGDVEGVPGALVSCGASPKKGGATETDAEGFFELRLAEGVRTIVARAPRHGAAIRRVEVAAGAETPPLILQLEPFGRIEGIVRRSDAAPLAAIEVEARIGEGESRLVATDAQGRFAHEDLPADNYLLTVRTEPAQHAAALVRPGETVHVAVGGRPQITGLLRGPLGRAPRNRSVSFVSTEIGAGRGVAGGADLFRAFAEARGQTFNTGRDGRFEVGGLAPGGYLIGNGSGYEEVLVPERPADLPPGAPGPPPVEVVIEPCVVEARLLASSEDSVPSAGVELRPLRLDLLERGLAGDGRALIESLLQEGANDLAASGGAAALVPRPGRYLLLVRGGGVVAADPVFVDAQKGGRAEAGIPLARASATVSLSGFPLERISLAVVRDAETRRVIATATFVGKTDVALAPGRVTLDVVHPERGRVTLERPAPLEAGEVWQVPERMTAADLPSTSTGE